jgi:hypothetical protein
MDQLRFIGATSVDFPIFGADASGPFVLKGAEGLGPSEIRVRLSRTTLEKSIYQGKSASPIQVIAVVGLQPDWDVGQTAEELRTILYGLLTPRYGQMVKVQIMHEGAVKAYAQGQVSKMEPAIFSKDPAVQITIDCDYPYWLGPDSILQEPVQSTVGGIRAFAVENDGTAPAGFKAGLILRANVGTTLTLSDENPLGQKFQVEGINWQSGDRFVIDTRAGTRGVWRGAAGGANVSVLNNMNAGVSEWLQLYGGDNTLLINTTAFDWDPVLKFSHQPAYWGV